MATSPPTITQEQKKQSALTPGAWLMVGITFVSAALAIWLVVPQAISIPILHTTVNDLESELEETNNKLLLLESYDQSEYQNRLDALLKPALPTEFDLPQIFNAIIVVAKEHDFELVEAQTLETNRTSVGNGLNQTSMELNFSGNPENFEEFAANIKKLAPIVKINGLKYLEKENTPTQFTISFETFIFDRSNIKPVRIESSEVPKFGAKDDQILSSIRDLRYIPLDVANTVDDPLRDPFGQE